MKHDTRDEDTGQFEKDRTNIGRAPQVGGPGKDCVGPGCETVERQNERKKGPR